MKQDWNRARRLARTITLAFASVTRTGVVLAGIALLATAVHAQYRASITGTITDTSGAVIPEAKVTLTDTETNKVLTTTADANGLYTFNALPPSRFTIVAEKQGFTTTPRGRSRSFRRSRMRSIYRWVRREPHRRSPSRQTHRRF